MDANTSDTNVTPETQTRNWFNTLRDRIDPQEPPPRVPLQTDRWFQEAMGMGLDIERADSNQPKPSRRTSQDVSMLPPLTRPESSEVNV